jgi:hypothetical protein
MSITNEEAANVKEQLLKQLDNFPEEKREEITNQINSMTTEQIEAFIEQNKLTHLGGQCIFCSIASGQTPSYKIAENKDSIAILEINPLSKGHSLVIPKEHTNELHQSTKDLAQELSQKLEEQFAPNEIQIKELKIMGHPLIEVIPIHGDETEKKQATEEELKSLQEEITKPKEIEIESKLEIEQTEDIPKLPPRIP